MASTDAINVHVEMAKRERLEKAKQKHGKTEITISFCDANTAMKEKIVQLTEQELAKIVKEHIHNTNEFSNIQIRGVKKQTNHILKIQCYQETDAQALHNMNWNELENATLIKLTYGVVIHRVSKLDIDMQKTNQEIKTILETNNDVTVA